jgi:16S rRNA (uracil1498-N3)-methyltransferase
MHRFFISPQCIDKERVAIEGKLVHQLRNVLRLQVGDHIVVLDDTGWEYEVSLERVSRDHVTGVISEKRPSAEPGTKITLYQALPKSSKFEFIIQKCTELGVSCFVPLTCERCIAEHPQDNRVERWQRIIIEAAEQSKRGRIPKLEPALPFEQACRSATGFSMLAWEGAVSDSDDEKGIKTSGLRAALQPEIHRQETISGEKPLAVNLFIGPEGGFSPLEVEFARGCGILPISLGKRVLRAETAGLVAASIILYEYGDLDPV